jgi:hypothetical protein
MCVARQTYVKHVLTTHQLLQAITCSISKMKKLGDHKGKEEFITVPIQTTASTVKNDMQYDNAFFNITFHSVQICISTCDVMSSVHSSHFVSYIIIFLHLHCKFRHQLHSSHQLQMISVS